MNRNHFLLPGMLSVLFCWLFSGPSFAQLDSTTATISVIEDYYLPNDSLDDRDMVVLELAFDDIADFGYVNIVVVNEETEQTVMEFFGARSDLQATGILLSDRLEMALFEPLQGIEYRIEVAPLNLFGAYTKMCFINLTI
ncbi:MAG TPA: hypothetical protein VK151_13870 [Fluviicola sp.]|nr:hypothetical protein [Fluviicola sp.]